MTEHHHMVRVQRHIRSPRLGRAPEIQRRLDDGWLSRRGDKVVLPVPGGIVTLELHGGWSESGIAYTRLTYEPRRAGLLAFARRRR